MRRLSRPAALSLVAALAAVFVVLLYAWLWEPRQLVQRDYVLPLRGWPASCDGLRVDVLADLHTGSWLNGVDNLDRIVGDMRASNSDVVVLAGDYVILSVAMGTFVDPSIVAQHLAPLARDKPVYAVLGNHDWWKNGPRIAHLFGAVGIHVLRNQSTIVDARGCRFSLVGIDDLTAGRPDVGKAFAHLAPGLPIVALEHEPAIYPRLPQDTVLAIAGHTHGGQVNPFGLRTPSRLVPGSAALRGEYHDGRRTLFVSPGIGTSWLPLRLGVPPEISRLTLRAAATGTAR